MVQVSINKHFEILTIKQIGSTKSNENSEKSYKNRKRLCDLYPKLTRKDFKVIKFIGRGSFSIINLAELKENGKLYALKQ